jgi:hypothetical protein
VRRSSILACLAAAALVGAVGLSACRAGEAAGGGGSTDATPHASGDPPTEDAGEAEGAAGLIGRGDCANPYYPVVDGVTRRYRLEASAGGTVEYAETIAGATRGRFTLVSQLGDLTVRQEWACTTRGLVALRFRDGAAAGLSARDVEVGFETTGVEGVTIPSDVGPGSRWTQTFRIAGRQRVPGVGRARTSGRVVVRFVAGGVESVTVPGGTFEALAIDVAFRFDLRVKAAGVAEDLDVVSTGTMWLAPGVGTVRSITEGEGFGRSFGEETVLTAFTGP